MNKKYLILLVIILTVGTLLSLTSTFAKYVKNVVWEYHLKTKGFYFSSLELNTSLKENVNNSWEGEEVYFSLSNSHNDDLITDYDINYEVTCSITGAAALHAECHLNGESSSEDSGILASYQGCINNKQDEVDVTGYTKSECELGDYLWKNQKAIKEQYFNIVLTDPDYELNTITVNIEVKSTLPYRKTLKGKFTLYKPEDNEKNIYFNYEDYDNYGKLIISNPQNYPSCVNLKWDSDKLIIDENLEIYNSYQLDLEGYINEIEIELEASFSQELIYFKKVSDELAIDDFIIGECLS